MAKRRKNENRISSSSSLPTIPGPRRNIKFSGDIMKMSTTRVSSLVTTFAAFR